GRGGGGGPVGVLVGQQGGKSGGGYHRAIQGESVMKRLRSGVVLQAVDPPHAFGGMVDEIDSLGFDHLWLTDSSLHARDCYAYLTLAATCSSRLLLGTAVTNPVTHHPAITAAAAATVADLSAG